MEILWEDNHLLAVVKPVGVATMGLPEGQRTLLTDAKDYIRRKYHKPGNVYIGVVSRLDVPVSGIVLFARTSKAADRLNQQFRNREVQKLYDALVEGESPLSGRYEDCLCEDKHHRRVWIAGVSPNRVTDPDGKWCDLEFQRMAVFTDYFSTVRTIRPVQPVRNTGPSHSTVKKNEMAGVVSLLKIQLGTGRKHQIRLQCSHHGFPIIGDRKYGAQMDIGNGNGIRLHAGSLTFHHPTTGETIHLTAAIPSSWKLPNV